MAKKIKKLIKLQCPAGKANPAPPVGTALGPAGVNIMDFCNQFNEKTREKGNTILPVVITVYEDRSFDFIIKQPPASILLKETAKVQKGAVNPLKDKVGTITHAELRQIAERKMPDLNANTLEEAEKIISGTAKSMGIQIK